MKYRTKIDAQNNPSPGEINENPSMTIEGEHKEMKDILALAMQGMDIQKKDTQYFRPDEIQQVNSLFRQSLDLTDLDELRKKTAKLDQTIQDAVNRKKEAQAELNAELKKTETETQPKE